MKKYIMLSDRGKCVIVNRVKPIYFLKKLFLCGKNIQDILFSFLHPSSLYIITCYLSSLRATPYMAISSTYDRKHMTFVFSVWLPHSEWLLPFQSI